MKTIIKETLKQKRMKSFITAQDAAVKNGDEIKTECMSQSINTLAHASLYSDILRMSYILFIMTLTLLAGFVITRESLTVVPIALSLMILLFIIIPYFDIQMKKLKNYNSEFIFHAFGDKAIYVVNSESNHVKVIAYKKIKQCNFKHPDQTTMELDIALDDKIESESLSLCLKNYQSSQDNINNGDLNDLQIQEASHEIRQKINEAVMINKNEKVKRISR